MSKLLDGYEFYKKIQGTKYSKGRDDIKNPLSNFRKLLGELTDKIFIEVNHFIQIPNSKGNWLKTNGTTISEYMWNRYKPQEDDSTLVIYFNASTKQDEGMFISIGLIDDKLTDFEKQSSKDIYNFLEQECKKINVEGFERKNTGWGERVFSIKKLEDVNVLNYNDLIEKLKNVYSNTYNKFYIIQDTKEGEKAMPNYTNKTQPINQILYGPPGTGKTYNTINKALEIIFQDKLTKNYYENGKVKESKLVDLATDELTDEEKKDIENDDRKLLKACFEKYKNAGQIEFVTFHQSYGYEEFVEGIKAKTTDKGIEYKIEAGIFKKLCEKSQDIVYKNDSIEFDTHTTIWKVSLAGSGDNKIKKECYTDGYIRFSYEDKFNENISEKSDLNTPLNALVNKMSIGDIVVSLDTNKTINQIGIIESDYLYLDQYENYKHARKVKWLFSKSNVISFYDINNNTPFANSAIHEINPNKEKFYNLIPNQTIKANNRDKNYILIIDEINRGNISKIFGELITLIEDSKRLGKPEQVEITLPYSGEKFGVPQNLYIIGTMNTADRSIALMDTALRRRFEFTEMMPKYEETGLDKLEIIKDNISINIGTMLRKINQRIEYLYDRDHTIGHAYFMSLKDEKTTDKKAELDNIFRNKIIPLLQEYFYDDWEKIRLVLGDNQKTEKNEQYQFIKIKKDYDVKKLFGDSSHELLDDEVTKVYEINKDAFEKAESYLKIYEAK